MLNRNLLLFGCLIAATATTAMGSVYKWTDDEGNVHYSDQAPSGQAAETVDVEVRKRPAPVESSKPPTGKAKNPADLERRAERLNRQQQIQEIDERQKKEFQQESQLQKQRCEQARRNLEIMDLKARVEFEDENGDRRVLSPEEFLEQKEIAQRIVDQECSGS